ncbi:hypothetical protein [Marinobacterium litorale]|uniref:hypothetical protein n=1 Tax=Marinobacterium litorale TaxID=404770 RepID=UPI000685711A|nr:hypothetical protein [Marinobacterium litorale]
MNTVNMTVTPEQAREWLKKNTTNRKLSSERVRVYAADMRNGNWQKTHQGIAFYEDGSLADGQHRLSAIIESGVSTEFLVTFGITKPAGAAIDTLRARKTTDAIRIGDLSTWVGKDEVSIANFLHRISSKGRCSTLSPIQAVEYCEQNKEAIQFACHHLSVHRKGVTSAPVKAAVACAYQQVDTADLIDFCESLISGFASDSNRVAVIRLREKLITDSRTLLAGEGGRREVFKLATRAIKAFTDRQEISKLYVPRDPVYSPIEMQYERREVETA